jgi:hypothetical protein
MEEDRPVVDLPNLKPFDRIVEDVGEILPS